MHILLYLKTKRRGKASTHLPTTWFVSTLYRYFLWQLLPPPATFSSCVFFQKAIFINSNCVSGSKLLPWASVGALWIIYTAAKILFWTALLIKHILRCLALRMPVHAVLYLKPPLVRDEAWLTLPFWESDLVVDSNSFFCPGSGQCRRGAEPKALLVWLWI